MGAVKPTQQSDTDPLDRCVVAERADSIAWARAQESAVAAGQPRSAAPPPIRLDTLPPGPLGPDAYAEVGARNRYLADKYDPESWYHQAFDWFTGAMRDPANVLTDSERIEHKVLSAKIVETIFPQATPEQARVEAMLNSPIGAVAWVTTRELGGSERAQDLALGLGQAFEGMAMAAGPHAELRFLDAQTGRTLVEAGAPRMREAGLPPSTETPSSPEMVRLRNRIDALRTPYANKDGVDPAMEALMHDLPELPNGSVTELQAFAARALGLPETAVSLRPVTGQETPGNRGATGASGAPVFLVKGQNNELLGAVKVFPPRQVREMGNELLAMQTLGRTSFQNMGSVRALAARKLPDGAGVLMMSPAEGEPIDNIMIRLGSATSRGDRRTVMAELREAVRQNAAALVDLHTVPEGSGAAEATALDRQVNSAVGIAREIGERVVSFNSDQRFDRDRLSLDTKKLVDRVDELVSGVQRNPGPASLVHGDFHPGNIFFAPEAGITVIDSGRLAESISADGQPIGSPARDLAAFSHKLGTFGVRYDLGNTEIAELRKLFDRSYAAGGPMTTPEAMNFFRARVALGAFLDALKRPASSHAALEKQLKLFKAALDLP